MKKYILILTVLTLWCSLFSLRNWESYTNTTRIYDALQIDNEIYLATWGGLIVYNTAREEFTKIYTKLDGLTDYDITTLDYIEDRNEILIGTRKGGVNRMVNGEFILALSSDLGLQSPRVNKIINFENKIFVATDKGLSVFAINNDFPFPSLIGNYHDNNGFANDNIWDMTILDNDYLILACDKYITSVHTDSLYLQSAWQNFEENFDRASGITNFGNRVVVSTDRGLYQQDYFDINNDWVDLSFNSLSDTIAFKSVYLESENELWASYGKWEDDQFFISNQVDIAVSKVNLTNLDYQDLSKDDFSKSLTYSIKKIDDIVTFLSWGEGFFQNFQGDLLQYKSNSISSNLITKMNVDKNSKLWICDGAISGSQSSVGMRGISQFDGTEWHNFNVDNSDILSNNIFSMEIDNDNNKYFGGWYTSNWQEGISIYNDGNWDFIDSIHPISAIGAIKDTLVMYACSGSDIHVLDRNFDNIHSFNIESLVAENRVLDIKYFDDKIFFGTYRDGILIWDDESLPTDYSNHWLLPEPPDLLEGGIRSSATTENQIYFVSENGFYLFEDYEWYKFDITYKIQKWNNGWQVEERYIVDQERLFGSEYTTPTAVFVDLFERIWIGSSSRGISVYDPNYNDYHNEFTNYTTENAPLLSDNILAFGYDPVSGKLYIGTDKGLNSVEIGKAEKTETELNNIVAYPNPFKPNSGEIFRIENLPSQTMPIGKNYCNVYDINGDLVIKLEEDRFFQFSWDGNNSFGKKCSSGIYYYLVSTSIGKTSKGTIVLIR